MNRFLSFSKKAFHVLTVTSAVASAAARYGSALPIDPKYAATAAAVGAIANGILHMVTTVNPSLNPAPAE